MALSSIFGGGGNFDYSSLPGGLGQLGGAAGELLGEQLEGETEEMKRRRLMLKQMQEAVSPMGASNVLGLPSVGGGGARGGWRGLRGG